jgi:uncharacterized protein YdeI (YjbR/CyaY-like superfamily)
MQKAEIETFCPASRKDWRRWLLKNHSSKQSVWLVYYKVKSAKQTICWPDAVAEALCFGWIDSKRISLDEERFLQFFSQRKINGSWSKVNKEKIRVLIEKGQMTKKGYESIDRAKQNGLWNILDEVENLEIPKDLATAFNTRQGSKQYFFGLSRSDARAFCNGSLLQKSPKRGISG